MDQAKVGKKYRSALGKWLVVTVVGLLFIGWLLNTPQGLLGKADAVGFAVCHRIDTRSFHIGERPLPLCVRCSGMYLGAMVGLLYQLLIGRKRGGIPPKRVLVVLGLFVIAFAIDGLNSYLHLPFFPGAPSIYEPSSTSRLLTGTGMGLVIAVILYPSFNQTVWQDWQRKPSVSGLRSLSFLVALVLLLDLLVLTEIPAILYPLSFISAAGVFILLSMVYGMLWVILFRKENQYRQFRQLWLPLLGGFGLALTQIIVFSVIRYALTGTWEGFHFG